MTPFAKILLLDKGKNYIRILTEFEPKYQTALNKQNRASSSNRYLSYYASRFNYAKIISSAISATRAKRAVNPCLKVLNQDQVRLLSRLISASIRFG